MHMGVDYWTIKMEKNGMVDEMSLKSCTEEDMDLFMHAREALLLALPL